MKDQPDCASVISFTVHQPFDDWVKSGEDYERWVERGNEFRERRIQELATSLPIAFLVGVAACWLVFFALRPLVRWVAVGFR